MKTPKTACPICKKPTVQQFRPFCSQRCADIDLHRWLNGSYALPTMEAPEEPPLSPPPTPNED